MAQENKQLPHQPVLATEVINFLKPARGGNFLDGTIGYGGHAAVILKKLSRSQKPHHYWGLDLDQPALEHIWSPLRDHDPHPSSHCDPDVTSGEAISNGSTRDRHVARRRRCPRDDKLTLVQGNFRDVVMLIKKTRFDGILLDLGVSSPQLSDPNRGLSFQFDAPLDMRLNIQAPVGRHTITAAKIINYWSLPRLTQLFQTLGEEPYSYQIAKNIVSRRQKQPIETTDQLVETIRKATPPAYRFGRQIHFATNTFRALRMAVNDELGALESFLKQLPHLANSGCRIVIISFHSLEDRLVKKYFSGYAQNHQAIVLTKKPVLASAKELAQNPRARSAKLRALEWSTRVDIV